MKCAWRSKRSAAAARCCYVEAAAAAAAASGGERARALGARPCSSLRRDKRSPGSRGNLTRGRDPAIAPFNRPPRRRSLTLRLHFLAAAHTRSHPRAHFTIRDPRSVRTVARSLAR
ncbi:unnamed protein product, partial [Iphiclides podalirius]